MRIISRRHLLATSAVALFILPKSSFASIIRGALPWTPGKSDPPTRVMPGPWVYFTPAEGAAVEALADRLIPPDPETPGGKDAGCAIFIDRQLAGPYGRFDGLYMGAPFQPGTKQQGPQSPVTPAQQYRLALAALDRHCRASYGDLPFARLAGDKQDEVIGNLENGSIKIEGRSGSDFFDQLLKDTRQGFFADPIYGGNKDMASWKMIGFPGARYDYRDWVDRHNERYPHPPIGIGLHPDWSL
ncbi:MAG TPA: gluconate 2-dehydrogenase subunit 3 family protein [Aliidongia sp.]|uniref:gluconate 2-dehydrogenase subunit 3 family protein n=1 Tax=Aliidongia sp. TaxID=1914230 RepID=UPI002DDCFB52|nr:gluconate 2-dehydrogenase subunit 3 family protein [Aliidongia sp.]HEV2673261.1 gluconate 2-dehydrogenase subunit 3 family protein [Aliidongia sp.]